MSAFSKFHPAALLTFFLSTLAVATFVQNPIISFLAFFGGTLTCLLRGSQKAKDDIKLLLPIFGLVLLTNPLFSQHGSTLIFSVGTLKITAESVIYGAQLGLMLVSVMLWCKIYNEIMTEDKLIYLFGRAFPKLSLVLSTALRYIPMLKRQSQKIARSRKAIGLYSGESRTQKLKASLSVFSSLISQSLEQAIETSRSMKARAYGEKKRTQYHDFSFKMQDAILMIISLSASAAVAVGSLTGGLAFEFYPTVSYPELSASAVTAYTVYGIACVTPFAIEMSNLILWEYRKSKLKVSDKKTEN